MFVPVHYFVRPFAQSMLHLFLPPHTHTFLFPLAVLHSRLNCQLIAITMFIYRFSFIPPTTHSHSQFSIMSRSAVTENFISIIICLSIAIYFMLWIFSLSPYLCCIMLVKREQIACTKRWNVVFFFFHSFVSLFVNKTQFHFTSTTRSLFSYSLLLSSSYQVNTMCSVNPGLVSN